LRPAADAWAKQKIVARIDDGNHQRKPPAERQAGDHIAWIMRAHHHPRHAEPQRASQESNAIARKEQREGGEEGADRRCVA